MADETASVSRQTLELLEGFRGEALVPGHAPIPFDEPEDVGGTASGPSPVDYLLTAVGSCLLSSLAFCLKKKRVVATLKADAEARVARDADGLLRVAAIDVRFLVGAADEDWKKVESCHAIFKKYCTVSSSVARGIPIETSLDRAGG